MTIEATSCRICKGNKLTKFLSLGDQPLANRFLKKEELQQVEPRYPLEVCVCEDCNLAQLTYIVSKEELFRDYIYFSSGMPKLSDHFRRYAEDIVKRFLKKNDLVVELASNDGILLKYFKDLNYRALGVDPALNVVKIAESLGVETIPEFFSATLGANIADSHGKAKIIMANNVVAHINDHHDLMEGIRKLLAEDGVFVFEAPYLMDMFENLTYDTIYHEHLSLLAVRPLMVLFEKFGLEFFDVEIHPVQGRSLRGFVGKKGAHPVAGSVRECVERELQSGLDKVSSYRALAERIIASKNVLMRVLREIKKQGKSVAAYGAPAKGNTLLNYCDIGTDIVDFALDDLPSKQGLYTPGKRIPVFGREYAQGHRPDYYLNLAWNYAQVIMEREKDFMERGGAFIMPVGNKPGIVKN